MRPRNKAIRARYILFSVSIWMTGVVLLVGLPDDDWHAAFTIGGVGWLVCTPVLIRRHSPRRRRLVTSQLLDPHSVARRRVPAKRRLPRA